MTENTRRGTPLPLAMVMRTVYSIQRFGWAAEITKDLSTLLGRSPTTFAELAERCRPAWGRPLS